MEIRELNFEEWRDALPGSGFDLFHQPAALSVVGDHAAGDLRLLGGFKGQRPVGLLPVVTRSATAGRAVLSPPPGMGIPHLGPICMPASPKRRKREQVNRTFVEGVLDHLGVDDRLAVTRILTAPDYADPRPFEWRSMDVTPAFTYCVDATGDLDETMNSFSKSLRREIRDARDLSVTIEREGAEGAMAVFEDAKARYEEQGERFELTADYVRDLVSALDDRARSYVVRDRDGAFLGGITVLYSDDRAYFWLGGARTVHEGTAVNGLLHWRIIEDVAEDPPLASVTAYDLMGANTARLCEYKAKFGGRLVPYYRIESGGTLTSVAKVAYRIGSR